MQAQFDSFDPQERAQQKERSRRADMRAVALGQKSHAAMKRENEVFAPLAAAARIDLAASRALG